jgi:hypothetical protein
MLNTINNFNLFYINIFIYSIFLYILFYLKIILTVFLIINLNSLYHNKKIRWKEKTIIRKKIVFWWEIWSFYNLTENLEKNENTPWYMYKQYKYSIWNNWHILEERISLFFIIFYIILI